MIGLQESNFLEASVCHRCQLVEHLQSKILNLEGQLAGQLHSSELEEFQELHSASFEELVCMPQLGGRQTSGQTGQDLGDSRAQVKERECTLHRGGISALAGLPHGYNIFEREFSSFWGIRTPFGTGVSCTSVAGCT